MTLQQHIEDSLEKVTPEVIKILSYQASITAQGINYTGEKDWALNKIKDVIKQSLLEQVDILREEVEKLDRYYGDDNTRDGMTREDDFPDGEWIKRQEVLDLLKTNQE